MGDGLCQFLERERNRILSLTWVYKGTALPDTDNKWVGETSEMSIQLLMRTGFRAVG